MSTFDVLTSPLRDGDVDAVPSPLVIDASAGTGKTWTLAHLAVRFMVEDRVEPEQVLLVTFTRDAARELRGRVREHLDEVIDFLGDAEGPGAAAADWRAAWTARWAAGATRDGDRRRALACRATLDGLHARTIHSFAALNALGEATGVGDDGRLRRQAIAETLARWALRRPGDHALVEASAGSGTIDALVLALYDAGVRDATGALAVDVVPEPGEAASDADRAARLQRELALEVVARYAALLHHARRSSFADLVVGLAQRLDRPDAQRFVDELRATFSVVMIDEFQDTDPLQWLVFRRVFLEAPGGRLVVVGDPKQAIYRFRSATIETFLEVREDCRARGVPVVTLATNRRSSPRLVGALNALFAGTDFHYEAAASPPVPVIGYEPATAHREDGAAAATSFGERDAPLHLRVAPYRAGAPDPTYAEVAAYIERAVAGGVPYREIAVLCASNEDCRRVHRSLARRRIPSTTTSDASIYECAAAEHLRHLLVALSAPEDASLTEALRATWFAGPGRDDPNDHGVGRLVTRLSGAIAVDGVAALTRFLRSHDVLTTVAGLRDAERHLTDLAHLSELVMRDCYGVTMPALVLAWLDAATMALDADEATATRRLETESDAVRVLTVHKAKGLEFDVVLLPDLVRPFREVADAGRGALRRWVADGRTVVDAGSGFAWGGEAAVVERTARTEAADAGEQRRLLYVALTRSRVSTVAWVRLRRNRPLSGELARLLLDRGGVEDGWTRARNRSLGEVRAMFTHDWSATRNDPAWRRAQSDPVALARENFARCPDVEVFAIGDEVPTLDAGDATLGASPPDVVEVARAPVVAYERRRWSYSDVARELKESGERVGDDVEETGGVDEAPADRDEEVLAESAVRPDVAGVFGRLAGTRLGLVVHRVLERAVGTGEDVDALLDQALREDGVGPSEVGEDRPTIRRALDAVLERPLSTLQGRGLNDVESGDVATEMRFVLALGEERSPRRLLDAVAAVVAEDRSGEGGRGLFASYLSAPLAFADRLSEGFLVGSLDLTVRGEDGRYRIVDYKTDQLAGARRPYAPAGMAAHMAAHHYPLQALFYAVALHRFLRSRLAGYDPDRHLGGVDYFFVRVVGDASSEPGDGLLTWAITPGAVRAASDALGGRDG